MTRLLNKQEIVFLNRNNIERFGGNFVPPNNFLHESSLDYLVEIIGFEWFGETVYPEIYHKAGVYLFNIISNHIFTDGNKKTSLDTCLLFLDFNVHQLRDAITNQILTGFILAVASGNRTLETVQSWLKDYSIRK